MRLGRNSRHAGHFDIDWSQHDGRVLLPVLADDLDAVVRRGELQVRGDVMRYQGHTFPISPETQSGDPAMLDHQHYLLAHWRRAATDLNYRRFFDVTSLAGLRVEDERVYADTHARILGWLSDGSLDGVRVDHPDGLADPHEYLSRLRRAAPEAYVVVEKILERGEELPDDWPVDGTTGYDALNLVTGLLVDPAGERQLTATYAEVADAEPSWPEVLLASKRDAVAGVLGSEVERLMRLLGDDLGSPEVTRDAVTELVVGFDVYRTYLRPGVPPSAADRTAVEDALRRARERRPDLRPALQRLAQRLAGGQHPALVRVFQQTSGPAMAKGVEDTAFYRYHRLVALNEVGGDPGQLGTSLDDFDAGCARTQERWPRTMTTLGTHDTKRSADVRARLALLSEIPEQWDAAVRRWSALAARHRRDDRPDRNIEYLMWQTLVGAWPLPVDRALAYLEKASREAKQHTSWTDPDEAYDAALADFVTAVLADEAITAEVAAFTEPLVVPGWVNALTQQLVQLTMPGMPDVYQGSELWDLSLVDPDNRRPVDYAARRTLLDEAERLDVDVLGERLDEGLPKLLVTARALRLRRERPELFGPDGAYTPLRARGPKAEHVVAFLRGNGAVTVAPRLVLGLGGTWDGTTLDLPGGPWINVLTGDTHPGGQEQVIDLLERFPVALLARERSERA